ncbi:MAG: hypothetical protein HY832_00875 [Candidatus Aenigmarchaeota archaeon]|nr:hypothetical protein [Candidatus Aenigmarchaeota archaeon]
MSLNIATNQQRNKPQPSVPVLIEEYDENIKQMGNSYLVVVKRIVFEQNGSLWIDKSRLPDIEAKLESGQSIPVHISTSESKNGNGKVYVNLRVQSEGEEPSSPVLSCPQCGETSLLVFLRPWSTAVCKSCRLEIKNPYQNA